MCRPNVRDEFPHQKEKSRKRHLMTCSARANDPVITEGVALKLFQLVVLAFVSAVISPAFLLPLVVLDVSLA